VVDDANLLASKYDIRGPLTAYMLVPLRDHPGSEGSDNKEAPPGALYSGTGFVIAPDGLILTNRHVVKGAKTMTVQVGGRKEITGKIVVIDDEQDLALVRVKLDQPLPFLQLSGTPAHLGAECTVMGFPMIDRFGSGVKITRGIVTGTQALDIGSDVMVDAKVNPGNSGGPILDKFGNVMGIVSMKSLASASEDSFGLGISAAQIKRFLDKNKVVIQLAPAGTTTLSTEDVVAKTQPATVCILSTH
jgi:S1-C subfamily serine protease